VASTAATGLAELTDLALYTPLRRRGQRRALALSCAISAVADTVLMLGRNRTPEGKITSGAHIKEKIDMVELGLAYRDDLESDSKFLELERRTGVLEVRSERRVSQLALREGCVNDRRWQLRKDGSRIWVDGMMRRLDDEQGNLRGFAKIARDATQERAAEEKLQQSRADLEALELSVNAGLPDDEFVVVQGVADLAVILPEAIWLVDFKTDRVSAGELPERARLYAPQLKLYARALSQIYRRPVTECWLYFLRPREGCAHPWRSRILLRL